MSYSKTSQLMFRFLLNYRHYLRMKRLVQSKVFLDREKTEAFQYSRLRTLIKYAYFNVPYYKKLFDKIGFHPNDFKSIEDIKKIPFLTKQIIRENQKDLISQSFPEKHIKKMQTGGTTGMPMEFLLDKRYATLTEMIFLHQMWRRLGYRLRSRCVVLREDNVKPIIPGKKYWKRSFITNWLVISAFHLNADTFGIIYRKIMSFKPEFILAFPSNTLLLARLITENNLGPIAGLKAIICASENLYDWQRKHLQEVFQTRIFSYYGHSEKCILAAECLETGSFEFYPQYGFVELINKEGNHCKKENERGEIVATGFNNFVTPFIRYKTDDIASYTKQSSIDHPHWFNIKKIEGRKQDFLIDSDNILKTYMHIDRPFWNLRDKVYAYQYIQDKPGKVRLHIHAKNGLKSEDLDEINRIFHETYFKFELEIAIVDNIPRSNRGKFRYLIQNIQTSDNEQMEKWESI